MKSSSRAIHRLAPLIALPLLAAPLAAARAPAHIARPVASSPKPIQANNMIIALPLAPVVPVAQRLCTSSTPSGLGYTMLRPGSGDKPAKDAAVLVNYVGYLAATGSVFDQGMRTPMPVGEVIPGFSQGIQLLAKSGIVRLCIPASMGYGAQGAGPIPPNSDLVFQVELLDFKTAAEMAGQAAKQTAEPAAQKDAAPHP